MAKATYWLDLFTGTTWHEFLDAGAKVSGFRDRRWKTVQAIKPGDFLFCYLTGLSATARTGSELRTVLRTNTDLLCRSLSRLLDGPSMRWEKMQDGTRRGYPIDMGYEAKLV